METVQAFLKLSSCANKGPFLNATHKSVGSHRSCFILFRCQRFCNRVYTLRGEEMKVKSYETHIFETVDERIKLLRILELCAIYQVSRCNEITMIDSNYRPGALCESWFVSDRFLFTCFTSKVLLQKLNDALFVYTARTTTTTT